MARHEDGGGDPPDTEPAHQAIIAPYSFNALSWPHAPAGAAPFASLRTPFCQTMSTLLTHGYFLEEDPHEKRIMKPYPPLGILYLSAYLKAQGHSVDVFDSTFSTMSNFRSYLDVHRPTVVGIYCNLMTKLNVLPMIQLCKARGCTVVLGGPEPPSYAAEYLHAGADVIVVGEGEVTLEELLRALPTQGAHRLHDVPGIIFRDEQGTVIHTPPRTLIQNLDTLPFPDREAIAVEQYIDTWRKHHGLGSVSLITARGCPYTCTWCSHGVYGFTHRRRSVQSVVDEIEFLLLRYRPDMLWIADDVFTINQKWFYEYYHEMTRRTLKAPFECITRADRVNEEILAAMADLGCFRVWFGSESGSQRVLDAMSRGVRVEQIQHMTRVARRYGIQVGLFVMLGYEGETEQDIIATIEHLKKTDPDTFLTTVAYPIKGTRYYEAIESNITSDLPWHRRTERDFIVRGRQARSYYWFAQRRMANEVLFEKLSRNGRSLSFRRSSAWAKAAIARLGMQLTRRWKTT